MNSTSLLNLTPPGTAVITGASSGLGAAFAQRLASYGFNLILIARRKERLVEIAAHLESEHSIKCESFPADLSNLGEIERVIERIRQISDLDILINNAGFATQGLFCHVPLEKNMHMLNVHMTAPMQFCHEALRTMCSRRRGCIINVASTGAFILMPGSVLYGATKAFLVKLSENLHQEIKKDGIKIQALCPGFIRTEFHEVGDFRNFNRNTIPKFLWMTPEKVVAQSLKALEKAGKTVFIPGWRYRIIKFLFNHVPLARWKFKKSWKKAT
jgi:short-subunit dehydrogenase